MRGSWRLVATTWTYSHASFFPHQPSPVIWVSTRKPIRRCARSSLSTSLTAGVGNGFVGGRSCRAQTQKRSGQQINDSLMGSSRARRGHRAVSRQGFRVWRCSFNNCTSAPTFVQRIGFEVFNVFWEIHHGSPNFHKPRSASFSSPTQQRFDIDTPMR